MGTPRQEQYPKTYCRKCENALGKPNVVAKEKVELYGIVPNEFGVITRRCPVCVQLWLGYVQKLPNQKMKIIMKMIDKEL